MKQYLTEALTELGYLNPTGLETLVQDNAHDPIPVCVLIDEILDNLGYDNNLILQDLAVSDEFITIIKHDGILDSVPLYKRVLKE